MLRSDFYSLVPARRSASMEVEEISTNPNHYLRLNADEKIKDINRVTYPKLIEIIDGYSKKLKECSVKDTDLILKDLQKIYYNSKSTFSKLEISDIDFRLRNIFLKGLGLK